jgi:hypothetical protein
MPASIGGAGSYYMSRFLKGGMNSIYRGCPNLGIIMSCWGSIMGQIHLSHSTKAIKIPQLRFQGGYNSVDPPFWDL